MGIFRENLKPDYELCSTSVLLPVKIVSTHVIPRNLPRFRGKVTFFLVKMSQSTFILYFV